MFLAVLVGVLVFLLISFLIVRGLVRSHWRQAAQPVSAWIETGRLGSEAGHEG
jgi:hypothetical protein